MLPNLGARVGNFKGKDTEIRNRAPTTQVNCVLSSTPLGRALHEHLRKKDLPITGTDPFSMSDSKALRRWAEPFYIESMQKEASWARSLPGVCPLTS